MRPTAALQLARTAAFAPLCDTTDAELLRRFCRERDEIAFRELLRRYEALVRDASGRLTRDRHAVDDAVQSTFLTLARKAHAIRHAEALPSWLYRVARSVTAREVATSPIAAEPADRRASPLDQLSAREVLAVFDEELARLPTTYRSAVLLCIVEGNTVDDAARRLATTPGAVRGWLQRGREQLRYRLGGRGVELSVALPLLAVSSVPAGAGEGAIRDAIVREALAHRPATAVARLLAGTSATSLALVGVLVAGIVSSVALLSPVAGDQPPVTAPKTDVRPEAKADGLVTRDGLPEGAVARIGSTRLRHGGEVVAVAFSHDGRWLATASPANQDKSVRVWNLADGKERYRIPIAVNAHESTNDRRVVAVAFSAGDNRLLVVDAEGFRSFHADTGRQELVKALSVRKGTNQSFPPEGLIGASFSPDAKTFAVVRQSGEMLLGNTATGEVKRTIAKAMTVPENVRYTYVDVLFTPDGAGVGVPIWDCKIPVFDTATGEPKRSLTKDLVPQNGLNRNAAFGPDGRTFVAVATVPLGERTPSPSCINVGDIATGKVVRTVSTPTAPIVLSVSPNGKLVAVGTQSTKSREIRVLDLESGKQIQSVPLTLTPALVTFSPDSRLLAATCHYEGQVTVWDLAKNALHPQSAEDLVASAHFDRGGHVVLRRSDRRTTTIDWRSGQILEDKKPEAKPSAGFVAAESSNGKMRAELEISKDAPKRSRAILIKEAATGRTAARMEGLTDFPRYMQFKDQNRLLVTVTQDDVLAVWDVAAGKLLWSETYPARAFGSRGMGYPSFDAATRRMVIGASGNRTTTIDVWDLRQHTRVARIEAPHTARNYGSGFLTRGIALSPNGEFIAGGNEAVTCWRVLDGQVVHTLTGHATKASPNDYPGIYCEFAPDGRKLLTVDGSGTIRVWELTTGQLIRTFSGHNGPTTAHFSADSRLIVGASYDAPVLVWDVYGLKAAPAFNAERVWNDLADASPATAFRAVRELCAAPKEATSLLKQKLKPESIDPKAIEGWIKDLSSDQFASRERATAELEKQGETIAPLLRAARGAATDAETRQRLGAILARTERLSPAALQLRRAMDALEHLGTPEAKSHLETLSRGSPGCPRTTAAREALDRISGR